MTPRPLSRRQFLVGLGVAGSAAAAAGYGWSVWGPDDGATTRRAVVGRVAPPTLGGRADRTLVVLELGGGNDGLSTIVPYADPAYAKLRPTLGVKDPIVLDGSIGLHPKLVTVADRFKKGQVAIVEGVGYPNPDLSHFASLATLWAGAPGQSGAGWLGRYLDGTVGFDDPLAAVGIAPVPSPALAGDASFATTIADTTGLQPALAPRTGTATDLFGAWGKLVPAHPGDASLLGEVQRAIALTIDARADLDAALQPGATGSGPTDDLLVARGGQTGPVAAALGLAAQLVASAHPPRVIYVGGLGDYDTHQGQAARHPTLMADLDAGIAAFFAKLDAAHATDRALVMTVSEFGRRAAENGSGTDHGTAAPHLLIGSQVKGGRYGAPPSLAALDSHGNVAMTTDFRVLYATALQGWLGVDAAAVLGPGFAPLPIVTG